MEENGQNNETGLYGRAYTGQYMERERLTVTYRECLTVNFAAPLTSANAGKHLLNYITFQRI